MYIIKSLKNKLLFASANSIFIPYIFWIYLLLILAVSCVYKWNISSRNISSFFARLYEPINHETSRLVFFWEKTRRDVLRRILWPGVREDEQENNCEAYEVSFQILTQGPKVKADAGYGSPIHSELDLDLYFIKLICK